MRFQHQWGYSWRLIGARRGLAPGAAAAVLTLAAVGCSPAYLVSDLFNLSVEPSELSLAEGEGGQRTVTVTMERGTAVFQGIELSVEGLPDGVEAAFDPPNPQDGDENTTHTAELTLTVPNDLPSGVYQLTVKGVIYDPEVPFDAVVLDTQTAPLTLRVVGEGGEGYTLTVSTDGEGTVTSEPPGIACFGHDDLASDCSEVYPSGTIVTLRAEPVQDFVSWFCPGSVDGNLCIVVMDQDLGAFAQFDSEPVGPDLQIVSSAARRDRDEGSGRTRP